MRTPDTKTGKDALRMLCGALHGNAILPSPLRVAAPWLSPDVIELLLREAETQRVEKPTQGTSPIYVPLGELGARVALGRLFRDWMTSVTGTQFDDDVLGTFIVYERPDGICQLHVDTSAPHMVNCLALLSHTGGGSTRARSALTAFDRYGEATRFDLDPGEAVVLNSDAIPHGRSALESGERIVLLSVALVAVRSMSDRRGQTETPAESVAI